MFKKKPTIKTLSPIRSSDRRKIADGIISDFQLQTEPSSHQGTGDDADEKAAAVAAHTALRNLVLPDNCLTARFSTTTGPDLQQVLGTVYVGSHEKSNEQRILWVSLFDRMYPSVYTLWQLPELLPLLHTPGMVVQKIKNGADLMTPGLAGPPFPELAKKDAIVAVADLDKPSVPIAVGTCRIDISALETTRGAKGCAVEMFHWAGDELWDWSTSGMSGIAPPDELDNPSQCEDEETARDLEALSLDADREKDTAGGVTIDPKEETYESQGSGKMPHLAERVEEEEGDIPTKDIEKAFRQAFIFGVYLQKKDNPGQPKYGLDFPLNQSVVMSHLVKPFLPTFTPKQEQQFDMKKTSWKNIRKFIKSLDKDGLLLTKDRQGNETTVMDIDFEDRTFTDFQPYTLPKREHPIPSKQSSSSASSNNNETADPSIAQKLRLLLLYRSKDILTPLFTPSSASPKSYYTPSDLTPIINTYIDTENLTNSSNKRMITLDPFLASLFDSSSSRSEAEILNRGSIQRDALTKHILEKYCTLHHAMLRNGDTLDTPSTKPKSGAPPKVNIQLETRSGNKTVTRVWGLEPFGIREQALGEELRKACASSTSVEASKLGRGFEVMVQGPQVAAVEKALERRGVSKHWCEVTDKTKGKKR